MLQVDIKNKSVKLINLSYILNSKNVISKFSVELLYYSVVYHPTNPRCSKKLNFKDTLGLFKKDQTKV